MFACYFKIYSLKTRTNEGDSNASEFVQLHQASFITWGKSRKLMQHIVWICNDEQRWVWLLFFWVFLVHAWICPIALDEQTFHMEQLHRALERLFYRHVRQMSSACCSEHMNPYWLRNCNKKRFVCKNIKMLVMSVRMTSCGLSLVNVNVFRKAERLLVQDPLHIVTDM